jgi:hypothetical protein
MPVTCPFPVRSISQEEFSHIDYHLLKLSFASQHTLGWLCDETIYENDLTERIRAAGLGELRR